VPVKTFRKSV